MDWSMDGLRKAVGLPTMAEVQDGLRGAVQSFDQRQFDLDRQAKEQESQDMTWRLDQVDQVRDTMQDFRKRWENRRMPWDGLRQPVQGIPGIDGTIVPNPNVRPEDPLGSTVRG